MIYYPSTVRYYFVSSTGKKQIVASVYSQSFALVYFLGPVNGWSMCTFKIFAYICIYPNISGKSFVGVHVLERHYSYVIMSLMASQITGASIVCSIFCSCADRRKHQSSALLASVRAINRWPVDYPHKGPMTRKCFHLITMGYVVLTRLRHCLHRKLSFCKLPVQSVTKLFSQNDDNSLPVLLNLWYSCKMRISIRTGSIWFHNFIANMKSELCFEKILVYNHVILIYHVELSIELY